MRAASALIVLWAVMAVAEDRSVHLYVSADRTQMTAAGTAIEAGVRAALRAAGDSLAGRPVRLVLQDHRGNSRRSRRHLEAFAEDSLALAMVCGLHSPPVLDNLDFINKRRVLLLDPWAAAAPITRPATGENWVFRLSVDDALAGAHIVGDALAQGYTRPYLLLEQTGWGESNERTMTAALVAAGEHAAGVGWFSWGLSDLGARLLLRDVLASRADVVLLVANAPEGAKLAAAMADLPPEERLPMRSHWGITGGGFVRDLGPDRLSRLDLRFLQTRFTPASGPTPAHQRALESARQAMPLAAQTFEDLAAPAGFVHAHDLTLLLRAALEQSGWGPNMAATRLRVKAAFEDLGQPVQGLLRAYERPFGPYVPGTPDAHEALGAGDLTMARYDASGRIGIEAAAGRRRP